MMTITRTFQCDLCRDHGEPHDLIGIYWQWEVGAQRICMRASLDTEHHLCAKCVRDVATIASELKLK